MARQNHPDEFGEDEFPRASLDEDTPDLPDIDWDSARLYIDQALLALRTDKKSSFIRDNVGRCLMSALDCLNFHAKTE